MAQYISTHVHLQLIITKYLKFILEKMCFPEDSFLKTDSFKIFNFYSWLSIADPQDWQKNQPKCKSLP